MWVPKCRSAEQHDQPAGEHREGDEDQDAGHQHVPGEDRHTEHGHARGAQVEDGGDQVDAGEDGGEPGQDQGHDPHVTADARRGDGARQRCVGHPAEAGGSTGHQEAQQHGDRAREVQPVAQGVEPGEGHVGCADLQRHDVVGQATEGERSGEQVEHQAAVHGEQLVVLPEREQRRVRRRQLEPDEQGHDPGEIEHDQRRDHVAETDHLVVGGGQPLEDPGRAVILVPVSGGVPVLGPVPAGIGRMEVRRVLHAGAGHGWGENVSDVSHRRGHLQGCYSENWWSRRRCPPRRGASGPSSGCS